MKVAVGSVGVDPGSGASSGTGIALFSPSGALLSAFTVWPERRAPLLTRLRQLRERLESALADFLLVEGGQIWSEHFVMRGKSGEVLQLARGAILSASWFQGGMHHELTTTAVKKRIGGGGKAEKEDVAKGVCYHLEKAGDLKGVQLARNLAEAKDFDALDAAALVLAAQEAPL